MRSWNSHLPLTSQLIQSSGWLARNSASVPVMTCRTSSVSVLMTAPSYAGVQHAGFMRPSTSTIHTLHAPGVFGSLGCLHSTGTYAPICVTASYSDEPFGSSTGWPLTVTRSVWGASAGCATLRSVLLLVLMLLLGLVLSSLGPRRPHAAVATA
eukprot:GHUV01007592.1.p2 GENE.GHUV01007592.1~~GHUV01007592.1.p2  ORF type:complete len:154 (-),score=10.88 GHUV01007592.1:370-831(-)